MRRGLVSDIPQLMKIRGAVTENRLNTPASVGFEDYLWYIQNASIWIIEDHQRPIGFSASDPRDGSIWAVFVDPPSEGLGIGQMLLAQAVADLAREGHSKARLTTQAGSRAEGFYRHLGWRLTGIAADGDLVFEKTIEPKAP